MMMIIDNRNTTNTTKIL